MYKNGTCTVETGHATYFKNDTLQKKRETGEKMYSVDAQTRKSALSLNLLGEPCQVFISEKKKTAVPELGLNYWKDLMACTVKLYMYKHTQPLYVEYIQHTTSTEQQILR